MLKCREITHLVASGELAEQPWRRRLAAWLHLATCRHCRGYGRQIDQVNEAGREVLLTHEPGADALERLVRRILDRRSDG